MSALCTAHWPKTWIIRSGVIEATQCWPKLLLRFCSSFPVRKASTAVQNQIWWKISIRQLWDFMTSFYILIKQLIFNICSLPVNFVLRFFLRDQLNFIRLCNDATLVQVALVFALLWYLWMSYFGVKGFNKINNPFDSVPSRLFNTQRLYFQYLGKWYTQYAIPVFFAPSGTSCSTANYGLYGKKFILFFFLIYKFHWQPKCFFSCSKGQSY